MGVYVKRYISESASRLGVVLSIVIGSMAFMHLRWTSSVVWDMLTAYGSVHMIEVGQLQTSSGSI